jgi:CheY-like chemotaxis protein
LLDPGFRPIYHLLSERVKILISTGTQDALLRIMISTIDDMTSEGREGFTTSTDFSRMILVVEDSVAVREIMTLALARGGYGACCAVGGHEARAMIAARPPALLITDLNMPFGDGWELIAYSRARYPELPILIVSGQSRGTCPEIESSANGYLNKPFDCRALLAEVGRLAGSNAAFSNAR